MNLRYRSDPSMTSGQKWKVDTNGQIRHLSSGSTQTDENSEHITRAIRDTDESKFSPLAEVWSSFRNFHRASTHEQCFSPLLEYKVDGLDFIRYKNAIHCLRWPKNVILIFAVIFRVYCADHTYITLKTAVKATANSIKKLAAEKIALKDEVILVEVKSNGEKLPFNESEVSVPTGLSINGRIFISPIDHIDALVSI